MYKITFSNKADKALRRMPRNVALNIAKKIKQLANDPEGMRNVKKLTNHPGYRLRVADWRIVYTVDDNELVKTRGEAYK